MEMARKYASVAYKTFEMQLSEFQIENRQLRKLHENALNEYAKLEAEYVKLREALQIIDAKSYKNTHWKEMEEINEIATEALK